MAWTGPGVDQIRSGYGFDLLSVLLSEGRTRLVRTLQEQQLVQAISSNFRYSGSQVYLRLVPYWIRNNWSASSP